MVEVSGSGERMENGCRWGCGKAESKWNVRAKKVKFSGVWGISFSTLNSLFLVVYKMLSPLFFLIELKSWHSYFVPHLNDTFSWKIQAQNNSIPFLPTFFPFFIRFAGKSLGNFVSNLGENAKRISMQVMCWSCGEKWKTRGRPGSYGWIILPNLQLCFFVCCLHSVVSSIYPSVCACVWGYAYVCVLPVCE